MGLLSKRNREDHREAKRPELASKIGNFVASWLGSETMILGRTLLWEACCKSMRWLCPLC
jgi:hypothetical protein